MGQKLRGFVGQGMSGSRKAVTPATRRFVPGSYTLIVPASGWYRLYAWGPGGRGGGTPLGGGGGGFYMCDRPLSRGATINIVVGAANISGAGSNTVITLPGGEVITAGAGKEFNDGTSPGGGGVATSTIPSNLDTATPGTTATSTAGGVAASSPSLMAGAAGDNVTGNGHTPGGGAGPIAGLPPGDGEFALRQIRIRPA